MTTQQTTEPKYTYRRSTDGCDETFDIYDPAGEHLVSVHFWEAEEWAESTAKLIVHRLNCHKALLNALRNLASTARTFRNVPDEQKAWTSIDEGALETAFAIIAEAEAA
jgi:hypothetical protein